MNSVFRFPETIEVPPDEQIQLNQIQCHSEPTLPVFKSSVVIVFERLVSTFWLSTTLFITGIENITKLDCHPVSFVKAAVFVTVITIAPLDPCEV